MNGRKYVSKARIRFEETSWDVYHLFDIHDELIGNSLTTKKAEKADVLVRSTYLFITACWESYIEDLCEEALLCLLQDNIKARGWIGKILKKHRQELVQTFHTPRSSNINNLYAATIGITNLTNSWKWNGMSVSQAQSKLGTYIGIRGAIAHRTQISKPISRKDAEDYLDFIRILVSKTERRVQNYVKRITGNNFGKIRIGGSNYGQERKGNASN